MFAKFKHSIWLILLILALGISACAAETPSPEPPATSCPTDAPTVEQPTQPPELTPTPTLEAETLQLGSSLFIQEEMNLTVVFMLENKDPNLTYTSIEYTVYAFDAAGATIGTDSSLIDFIAPGESFGAVSMVYLDELIVVEKVDVEWTYAFEEEAPYQSPFSFSNTRFFDDLYFDVFTGLIANDSTTSYTDLRVNAIGLDMYGRLVGGGIGAVNIMPGKERVGVNVYGSVTETSAQVVFYPTRSLETASYEDGDWRNNLKVLDFGFVQDAWQVGGGFLVKNITDQVIMGSQYLITVYEADGTVSNIASGKMDILFPGETLGISPGSIPLFTGAEPSKVDVVVLPGDFAEHPLTENPLVAEYTEFEIVDLWPRVTVMIKNKLNSSITDLFVYVLLFNEKDEIVGGGTAFPENIEAGGKVGVYVPVNYVGTQAPARIAAYPVITEWSEILP